MAACGSLQQIFEKPSQENPTLLESLSSWNHQIMPVKPIQESSFTDLFCELYFKDNCPSLSSSSSLPLSLSPSSSSSSSSLSSTDFNSEAGSTRLERNNSFESKYDNNTLKNPYASPRKYESLQLCTEGLGFESLDDVADLKNDTVEGRKYQEEKTSIKRHPMSQNLSCDFRRSSRSSEVVSFPPPISCIGKSGKPSVCFQTYRHDGRFVLKEVRIPTQEFLHACREDGRLKLQLVQPNDELNEELEEAEVKEENCAEENEGLQV